MRKTRGLAAGLVTLIMVFALTGSANAINRPEISTLLKNAPHDQQILETTGNFQRHMQFESNDGALLPAGNGIGYPARYRLARAAYGGLPTSDTCYVWEGGQWVCASRNTYVYGSNQMYAVVTAEECEEGQWVYVDRYTYTYDGNNNVTSMTIEEWQGGQWENAAIIAYTYDGSGNLIEILTRFWQDGGWVNLAKTTQTFTGTLLQTSTTQIWDDEGEEWVNATQYLYYYDGNNRESEVITQFWFGLSWVNSSRTTYAYYGSGYQWSEVINQSWLGTTWNNQSRTTYTYDGNGQQTMVISYNWTGVTWLQSAMWQYTYDGSGNEILAVNSIWGGSAWVETEADTSKYSGGRMIEEVRNHIQTAEVERTQYTWAGDYIIADLDQVWQGGAWVNEARCAYVYASGSGILCESEQKPAAYALAQNYPNPFNATTVIRYSLDRSTNVELAVFNILGEKVAVLENGVREAGPHETIWNGMDRMGHVVPSGIYFYQLTAGENGEARKMVLLK